MTSHGNARKPVRRLFSFLIIRITSGSSKLRHGLSRASKMGKHLVPHRKESDTHRGPGQIHRQAMIDRLPDDVLLDIFEFYRLESLTYTWGWHTLVHVCRRWRHLIHASPHRLDLRLLCTERTLVRELLNVWPPLPIAIDYSQYSTPPQLIGGDNLIAALEHRDRVSSILLRVQTTSFLLKIFSTVMQEPFPALTHLFVTSRDPMSAVLLDTFLGGSAPRLRSFILEGIPFPALPRFFSAASDLVNLQLSKIPVTGYISPEEMVRGLSALAQLVCLTIEFQSPSSRPDRTSRRLSSHTRLVLPALTEFWFQGVSEYLEDFLAQIDTPQIALAGIQFFNQLIFNIPQFTHFAARPDQLKSSNEAVLVFDGGAVVISLHTLRRTVGPAGLEWRVSCRQLDWQVSSMAQICSQVSPISSVEQLEINERYSPQPVCPDDMDSTQWLELFHPFTAVKTLCVSERLGKPVASALQLLTGERAKEVLPALHSIFFEGTQPSGSVQEAIEPFVAARQSSSQPIAIHRWEIKR